MKTIITTIISFVILISCQTKTTIKHTLTYPTMVSIQPDSETLEKLSQKWGEEDFEVIIDDIIWYHSDLMILVDSLNIDQITTESKNIKLIGGGKQWEINMDTTDNKWRYIYFDGEDFLEKDAITMRDLLSIN